MKIREFDIEECKCGVELLNGNCPMCDGDDEIGEEDYEEY